MKKFAPMAILLLTLSLFLSAFSVSTASAAEDSWTSKAPMPIGSYGVAVLNGKIYAIGTNKIAEYDPAADTWALKEPMPANRSSFALAVYKNKIYVIGGSNGLNQVYDPATETWENRTSMPTPRTQLEANVVNGKIYLISGRTGGPSSTVALNEVYDPETDNWTTKEPIPYPVVQYASAVVDNKIYVIGGQDEYHSPINLNLTQIYDTATDTWSFGAPLPKVVWQAATGATTGEMAPKRIYVIGGLPDKSMVGTNMTQVYDPATDTWTIGESMPTARFTLHVAVLNDTLYVMGGLPFFNLSGVRCQENEQYTPVGYIPEFPSLTTIYIRADGSVEGTDKIQRDGNIYTLTGDIFGNIVILKDFITIDGAGFTLKGSGVSSQTGIKLFHRKNVTVTNLVIIDYFIGIFCRPGSGTITNITILSNYIHDCDIGVIFQGTSNNLIKYNTFKNNSIDIAINYVLGDNLITQNSLDSYVQVWMSDQPTIDMNYWTAYNGTDNNGDGIGDSAYYYHDILRDSHPLMDPVPVIPEFPSWTPLLIMLLAVTAVAVIYRRSIHKHDRGRRNP